MKKGKNKKSQASTKVQDNTRVSPGVYRNAKGKLVNRKKPKGDSGRNTRKRKKKDDRRESRPEPRGREISIFQTDSPRQIIYGKFRVGGVFSYVAVTPATGPGDLNFEKLHLIITLAGHEIDGVETVWLDGRLVVFGWPTDTRWSTSLQVPEGKWEFDSRYLLKIFMDASRTGYPDQTAQPDIITQTVGLPPEQRWTSEHRQLGCAHVYMILRSDGELFPSLPDFDFLVRGKKVYDPRDGLTNFSQNGALIIADYIMDPVFGLGASLSDIDIDDLIESANICEEQVPVAGGGIENRYDINGVFDSDATPRDILEEMATAIAGDVVYEQGKWRILAGRYKTPEVTLTRDNLRGPIQVVTKVSRKDNFNRIRGTYSSVLNGYESDDFPPVYNSFYESLDGEPLWKDVVYNFVVSPFQAQRCAKVELERARQSITVEASFDLTAWKLRIGDSVNLVFPENGWNPKIFRVEDIKHDMSDQGLVVPLVLSETAAGVYAWNGGQQTSYDLAPNSALPSPYNIANPRNVTLTSGTDALFIRGDGTIWSRIKVEWESPFDGFVSSGGKIRLQFRRSNTSTWLELTEVPGNQTIAYVTDVQDGAGYDVRLKSVSSLGIEASTWVEIFGHVVIGKSEPPSDVLNLVGSTGKFSLNLSWSAVDDLDLKGYEIREGESWDLGRFVDFTLATSYSIDPRTANTYRFHVKAQDTSKNYSLNAATVDLSVFVPGSPVLTFSFIGEDIALSWTTPTSFLQIDDYEIRFGPDYATSQLVTNTKANGYRQKVTWIGPRRFWVAARDVSGNLGAPAQTIAIVQDPNPVVNLRADVVDNNVNLLWEQPSATSLPVQEYRVFKGDTFSGSSFLGAIKGTFYYVMELVSGTYTYWVQTVDTAGNVAATRSTRVFVNQPPDFVLRDDRVVDLTKGDQIYNAYIEGYGYIQGEDQGGSTFRSILPPVFS